MLSLDAKAAARNSNACSATILNAKCDGEVCLQCLTDKFERPHHTQPPFITTQHHLPATTGGNKNGSTAQSLRLQQRGTASAVLCSNSGQKYFLQ